MVDSLNKVITYEEFKQELKKDFMLAWKSRYASIIGRKEVLTGKAKFGIFGDGKEIAQIAMSKIFRYGDFRSGYYRDQTLMMAIGEISLLEFFSSLYGNTDLNQEPSSGGRQMVSHFSTRSLDNVGLWKDLTKIKNSSSDISCTSGQMPRLLGLAQASKIYRNIKDLPNCDFFSNSGNEIAFGTIGNASTSEGLFFETINAAGVLKVPILISIWDDEYGISVPASYQTTKENISEILMGFKIDDNKKGFQIYRVKGWDYPSLVATYQKAEKICRENHIPCIIHVTELTQPLGHSTSGSHERYKSNERLKWEKSYDPLVKMSEWIIENKIFTKKELENFKLKSQDIVISAKNKAWKNFCNPIINEKKSLIKIVERIKDEKKNEINILKIYNELMNNEYPIRKDLFSSAFRIITNLQNYDSPCKEELINWYNNEKKLNNDRYSSKLYSESIFSVLNIEEVLPEYKDEKFVDARIIIRDNFDKLLDKYPNLLIFGEDSGKIGDVNQGLENLQDKYGEIRVSDTGIREATIIGQGIGLAMRGLRPIAEIQYIDYLIFALQTLSDDLATLHYRTKGGQKAPLIIRTRGHRLEGIWHSGSPMSMIINSLRGINILVPRNMTKAAGMYNLMLSSDEPALIVECLNGYRLKEKLPSNLGEFKTPVGIPEIIKYGEDITVVSYGSILRLIDEASKLLTNFNISIEIIDIQTLIPFDINHMITKSISKTNRVVFIDEDVPGGTTAYMMQQVIEKQNAYIYLDSPPKTLASKEHRPAYTSDGDYFSKPNIEDIFQIIYNMMNEYNPHKYPKLQ